MQLGQFVVHPTYGIGIIVGKADWAVRVAFENGETYLISTAASYVVPLNFAPAQRVQQSNPLAHTVTAEDCALLWSLGIRVDADLAAPR